jgi:diadenylate cyclase
VGGRFAQLYESVGPRDLVQIAILAIAISAALRFFNRTRSSGLVRGLGVVVVGLFLGAQVVIATFDLTELGRVLDYLLTIVLTGLLVIFQPELRRGLMVLGRSNLWRYFTPHKHPLADKMADAAEALSRERVGALIAIEREVGLAPYIDTGERIDAEISPVLLRTVFYPRCPLHDGAVIVQNGRIAAAACQLPLSPPADGTRSDMGMRHRAALSLSEETDAVVLVVSEETGRISLGVAGRLEPVPRENLSRRLAAVLSAESEGKARKAG